MLLITPKAMEAAIVVIQAATTLVLLIAKIVPITQAVADVQVLVAVALVLLTVRTAHIIPEVAVQDQVVAVIAPIIPAIPEIVVQDQVVAVIAVMPATGRVPQIARIIAAMGVPQIVATGVTIPAMLDVAETVLYHVVDNVKVNVEIVVKLNVLGMENSRIVRHVAERAEALVMKTVHILATPPVKAMDTNNIIFSYV